MVKENTSYKTFFINYGIFVGIIIITVMLSIYTITASKKSWQKNLKNSVEKVLDENDPNNWTVENFQQINNPFTLSAACYDARNRKTGEVSKAVILRVSTFYGPLSAVFLMNSEKEVTFVGYSSLHGRIANQMKYRKTSKRIEFWTLKLPEIIGQ